jgi:hypothetical protein
VLFFCKQYLAAGGRGAFLLKIRKTRGCHLNGLLDAINECTWIPLFLSHRPAFYSTQPDR